MAQKVSVRKDHSRYHSFLVRMWSATEDKEWRATVQEAQSGELHHFGNLEGLLTYILKLVNEQQTSPETIVEGSVHDTINLEDSTNEAL